MYDIPYTKLWVWKKSQSWKLYIWAHLPEFSHIYSNYKQGQESYPNLPIEYSIAVLIVQKLTPTRQKRSVTTGVMHFFCIIVWDFANMCLLNLRTEADWGNINKQYIWMQMMYFVFGEMVGMWVIVNVGFSWQRNTIYVIGTSQHVHSCSLLILANSKLAALGLMNERTGWLVDVGASKRWQMAMGHATASDRKASNVSTTHFHIIHLIHELMKLSEAYSKEDMVVYS